MTKSDNSTKDTLFKWLLGLLASIMIISGTVLYKIKIEQTKNTIKIAQIGKDVEEIKEYIKINAVARETIKTTDRTSF